MRDLADLMNDALAERSGSLAGLPTAPVGDQVRRRVRFRRARRHTLEVGGVTAAVALLGSATWFGLNESRHQPAPAVSPTVSTPTPSGSPSPAPTTSATAPLDEVPGLPPTRTMPAGLLEQTGPGWVLTTYRSTPQVVTADDVPAPVVHTVVLVSPTGDRYRVVDLPLDLRVSLLHWDAGSTTALVATQSDQGDPAGEAPRAVLDLATGQITTSTDDLPASFRTPGATPQYLGRAQDGAELWTVSTGGNGSDLYRIVDGAAPRRVAAIGGRSVLDETGRWLAAEAPGASGPGTSFVVVDAVTGAVAEHSYGVDGKACDVVGWTGTTSLLATCSDPSTADGSEHLNSVLIHVDLSAGRTTPVGPFAADEALPWSWRGVELPDGALAVAMVDHEGTCAQGVSRWDGQALVPLPGVGGGEGSWDVSGSGGGVLYLDAYTYCDGSVGRRLVAYDVAAGSSVELAPAPLPTGDVSEWAEGLESALVAGT